MCRIVVIFETIEIVGDIKQKASESFDAFCLFPVNPINIWLHKSRFLLHFSLQKEKSDMIRITHKNMMIFDTSVLESVYVISSMAEGALLSVTVCEKKKNSAELEETYV